MKLSSSRTHRCDEFPAEYSLASCSRALLASASSAALMLQPTTLVRRANLSERQPGNSSTVPLKGVTLVPWFLVEICGFWAESAEIVGQSRKNRC